NPGGGMGALFRRFSRSGGEAPLADPGNYTVVLKVGDQTHTRLLKVHRQEGYTGNNSPFAEEWLEVLEELGLIR
ncbi:MAG TPA: hypothetical protein VLA36_00175, partial [Longimicrobiales bacterium]|nr:hypothetical protein [Longimicrobiales bacterium]